MGTLLSGPRVLLAVLWSVSAGPSPGSPLPPDWVILLPWPPKPPTVPLMLPAVAAT